VEFKKLVFEVKKKVLIVEDQFVEANDLQLILKKADFEVCGIANSVLVAQEMIRKERPDFVLLDIFLKGKLTGIDLARELRNENIAFIYLSANSNEEILTEAKKTEPYGFIVKPFRRKDLLVTLEIAQYLHEHSRESRYRRKTDLLQQLEKIATEKISLTEKLLKAAKFIQQEIPFDYLAVGFDDVQRMVPAATSFLRIGFNEYQIIGLNELVTITGLGKNELLDILKRGYKKNIKTVFNDGAFEENSQHPSLEKLAREKFHMKSMLVFPLSKENRETVSFHFFSRRSDSYNSDHIALLQHLQDPLRSCLEGMEVQNADLKFTPIIKGKPALADDHPAGTTPGFEGVIGRSHLLLNVFDQISQVAPVDTSVLILGESGTGKERIADCIHNLSSRKGKALIKINCATLPATLIESELFGHEKGSFTGAIDKRIGKFELANGGTIFLDEIGEMPVDLQVKLLRVLQEKEIEPIGARSPIKADVRIVAATNKNLEKEVGEGRFRLDLYYRLNVFPVELPPLRERTEDIPLLVQHFIHVYNRKSGKKITGLSDKAMNSLMSYHWPGNIRELEHMIERSVLLAKSTIIEEVAIPGIQNKAIPAINLGFAVKTIHQNERDYIIEILKKCNGRVWGVGGAAEILNIPPSTLKSRMKKLGISKHSMDS